MIRYSEEIGYNCYNTTIGKLWIDLLREIYTNGDTTYDEKRERKSIQNVRVRIKQGGTLEDNDNLI